MKKLLILLSLALSLNIAAQERFYNLYEGWKINKVDTVNNHYISYGSKSHPTLYGNTLQFNIIDNNGDSIESYYYSNPELSFSIYRSKSYKRIKDTLYIVGAFVDFNKSYTLNPILIKYNMSDRNIIDTVKYTNFTDQEPIIFLIDTTADGFIFTCDYKHATNTSFPMLIFTDHSGEVISTKQYSFLPVARYNKRVYPYQLLKLNGGGFILTCQEDLDALGSGPEKSRVWYLRLDNEGNEIWRKRAVTNDDTCTYHPFIFNMPQGDPLIIWTDPYLYNHHQDPPFPLVHLNGSFLTARIDTETGTIYNKRNLCANLEGFENRPFWINDYYQDKHGNIYLTGEAYLSRMSFLLKINPNGDAVWMREYLCYPENNMNPQYTKVYGLTPTPDGGFIMGGEFQVGSGGTLFPSGIQRGLVIKVDECGCLEDDCDLDCYSGVTKHYINAGNIMVYPNPAKDHITCSIETNATECKAEVYNISGSCVVSGEYNIENIEGGKGFKLDVSLLPAGVYLLNVWAGGKLFSSKFIK